MKKIILVLAVLLSVSILRAQDSIFTVKIRKEYPSGIEFRATDANTSRPLIYLQLDIFLNDSLHYKYTTDSIGSINYLSVPPGQYSIKILAQGFQDKIIKRVPVNSGKSHVYFSLNRSMP